MKPFLLVLLLTIYFQTDAQRSTQPLRTEQWPASWISVPGSPPAEYGVYLFRKEINFSHIPQSFIVHVSADNRYKLYVNGQFVSLGPARGDIEHWNYESLNLAPFLQEGANVISAKVWNEAGWRPEGEISLQTGFILQGDDDAGICNTGTGWKCLQDSSYLPLAVRIPNTYYVAGPGEQRVMESEVAGWMNKEFDDFHWKNAQDIGHGHPKNVQGGYGTVSDWMLVPSIIPPMEMNEQRLQKAVITKGITLPDDFPFKKSTVMIPAHSTVDILFDQGRLTNAYPEIEFSGGKKAMITLAYAEALYDPYPVKGNRNDTKGKIFIGRKDSIISSGRKNQVFIPLAFRTFRYLRLQVETKEDPLTIEDIAGKATGYPFRMNAKFYGGQQELNTILDIGWRTARLCAMETYMDCPYYEQLQYIGDTRIQALVSLYNSGDDRLMRNALNLFDHSRRPEGVTFSRHPSYTPQYIPTFSLWYVGMLHDYMMYGKDSSYIRTKLAGSREVLQYFRNFQQSDGSLNGVPHWMFTDWVTAPEWNAGRGPVGKDGCSALFDLQLLWGYEVAADMEMKIGMPAYAKLYTQYADQLKKTIRSKYWDEGRRLFADRSEKDLFSQHANALAILTGVYDSSMYVLAAQKLLSDTGLARASIYFKYYLHQALIKAGMGNDYLSWLDIWRENIKMGMTTWAEFSDLGSSRSDCHAWGASPNIEFYRTILGMDSDQPGFASVRIEPHLGSLRVARGEIPHPNGKISAAYEWVNGHWQIRIDLPAGVTGNLIWKNQTFPLKSGKNQFVI